MSYPTHLTLKGLLSPSQVIFARDREACKIKVPYALGLLLVLAFIGLWFGYNLDGTWINDDEGQYLYETWRIQSGEIPYRDFMTAQMPLFLYFGALIQWLSGSSGLALRIVTVLVGLGAACLLWQLGRYIFSPSIAFLALVPFALNSSVYEIVRVFRSDPYMLLLSTGGLLLFIMGLPERPPLPRRRAFAWAGLCFGLATDFKLFGLLSAGGCGLYLLWDAWRRKRDLRALFGDLVAFAVPVIAILLLTTALFLYLTPDFPRLVVGHHLRQGSDLGLAGVIHKNVHFFERYIRDQPLFLLLVILGIPDILRAHRSRALAILCQIPTAAAFLLLSRPLGDRHLVYLFPALALLWAAGLVWTGGTILRLSKRRPVLGWAGLAALAALAVLSLVPYARQDIPRVLETEHDTPKLVALIKRASPPGATMISDYQGLNFYAQRPGTYTSAGISTGAARSGQITATRLIQEIQENNVHMIVLEFGSTSPRLASMPDFNRFYEYVQSHFALIAARPWGYPRGKQWLEFYSKTDIMPHQTAISFENQLMLTGYALSRTQILPGKHILVTLRWRGLQAMSANHSVSLRLLDSVGNVWTQCDTEIAVVRYHPRYFGPELSPLHTGSWRPGQTAIQTVSFHVPPTIPPGTYHIELVVYETKTQHPLRYRDELTQTGHLAYSLGMVTITRPQPFLSPDELPIAASIRDRWGPFELLGRGPLSKRARPGDYLHFSLFWQARQAPGAEYKARFWLVSQRGGIYLDTILPLAGGENPTRFWQAQEIWEGQYRLRIPLGASAGTSQLMLNIINAEGAPLGPTQTLARIAIQDYSRIFKLPRSPQYPREAVFGDIARLLGYDLARSGDGQRLMVTLYWQALATADVPYTAFVHLLNDQGQVVAQHDSPPEGGARPAVSWLPGEIIVDTHQLSIPPGSSLAHTRLEIGLYKAMTLERLPVYGPSGHLLGDALLQSVGTMGTIR
ncbi:MAG: glycosyltransferase family 39 protein [Anaerolineae bacterium]|nr:glycosyltransferase family 39 protein [Anaerolineae bacterium]